MRSQITKVTLMALSALIVNFVSAQSLFDLESELVYGDGFDAPGIGTFDLEMALDST